MLKEINHNFKIILILVKRDYAVQFAGSLLGILWALIQNLVMIGVYTAVFLVFNIHSSATRPEYIPYIFSGLLFWLPISDYLVKGTGILTENRHLIKRSPLGMKLFLWVPFFQYMIHLFITSIPVFGLLYYLDFLSSWFALSYVIGAFTGLYILLLLNYLSRLNIILKDISPLVRLASQFVFWSLPILYFPGNEFLNSINQLNPLNYPLALFRAMILQEFSFHYSIIPFLIFIFIFLIVWYLAKEKFSELVTDHL